MRNKYCHLIPLIGCATALAASRALAIGPAPTWQPRQTVTTGLYGANIDDADRLLAYDHHGNPGIAWTQAGTGFLMYSRLVPGAGWQPVIADGGAGGNRGYYPSLAIDRYENPAISSIAYLPGSNTFEPRYDAFNVTAWGSQALTPAVNGFYHSSMAFDSTGKAAVAYTYAAASTPGSISELRYIKDANGDGVFGESPTAVSTGNFDGRHASLAVDPLNRPMIAHQEHLNGDLRFSVLDTGLNWVTVTVDSTGVTGLYPSLAIDPDTGYPAISYYDDTADDLRLASWNGTSWALTTIDSTGDVGRYTSLAFDPADGNPAISYYDATNGDLKLAWFNGASWQTQPVDTVGNVGIYTTLAFNDFGTGFPSIAYANSTSDTLYFIEDPPAVVPEPSSAMLSVLAGSFALAVLRWRRGKERQAPILLPCIVAISLVICLEMAASAGQPYFVADGYAGNVHRLEDINGDGDALDAGERTVWAANLVNAFEIARYGSGLLATDPTNGRLQQMVDLNGDGDALDAGEVTTWAQGFGFLNGVSVDRHNAVYFTDYITSNRVYRAMDGNNDGDALDTGEVTLFNDGIVGPVSVLARRDDVLVTSYTLGQVHRLIDANHDGDALDTGENLVHTPNTIAQAAGLLPTAKGDYLVGSLSGNAIFRVRDTNVDGDALDVAETLVYADNVNGPINGSWGLAPRIGGGFLAANYTGVGVVAARDKNGDGDALDVGESLLFADGLTGLAGIVAGLGPGPANRMITIQASAGTLDIAAPNFVAIVEGSTLRNTSVATRLNSGTSVLVSTDAPDTFADGNVAQLAGAPITKAAGGVATLTIRADDSIELAGGISSTSGALNVVLVANDATLAYRDNDTSAGDVVINAAVNTGGGSFTSSGVNFNNTGGSITAGSVTLTHTGTITIGAPLNATSLFLTASGGLNVTPTGQLKGANEINGNFVNAGQISPGASPGTLSISGTFTQLSTGHLAIELGGVTAGVTYDQLQVSGTATLAGALDVTLVNGFMPALGNQFTALTFASRSGDFATYTGLNVGGHLTLRHAFTANSLLLTARPAVDGDINTDGTVDIFDINDVSAHWSQSGPAGDANGDGIVDIFDINLISSNWGATGVSAVPEPATAVMALCGLLTAIVLGYRPRRSRIG